VSGSSVVIADSRHFRVEIESVRKVFADPEDEGPWHTSWREQNQPHADRARDRIARALPKLAKRLPLADYTPELIVVVEGNEGEETTKNLLASKQPFAYRLWAGGVGVYVALRALPAAPVRAELKALLTAAVAAP